MTRILVTGSRAWDDQQMIRQALEGIPGRYDPPYVLVHGGAAGADRMAERIAKDLGWRTEAHIVTSGEWHRIGRSAGIRRNQRMVDRGADICLAFWKDESRGTAHCIQAARKAGITVAVYRPKETE